MDMNCQKKETLNEIQSLREELKQVKQQLDSNLKELDKTALIRFKNQACHKKYPNFSKIVETVYRKSRQYGFDPDLILAIIQIESDFKQYAVSPQGAFGLMQVNYSVWKNEFNINPKKIFEIGYNIDLGLRILKHYSNQSNGDLLNTLHLYNNGYLLNNESYKFKVISTVFY
jgi:soluble lytic murein transglycosylase-like protein